MTKSDANPKCERAIDIYRSWIADSPPTEPEAWDSLATSLLDEVRTRFAGVEGADDEIAAYLAACSDSLTRRNRLTATPPHSRCVWPSDDRHGRW